MITIQKPADAFLLIVPLTRDSLSFSLSDIRYNCLFPFSLAMKCIYVRMSNPEPYLVTQTAIGKPVYMGNLHKHADGLVFPLFPVFDDNSACALPGALSRTVSKWIMV